MLPKYHILIGLVFSSILYLIFNISIFTSLLVFFSSFLIDVDHYIIYIFKTKDFSLTKTYKCGVETAKAWRKLKPSERKKYKKPIFIFHGVEFWIFLLLLSFFNFYFFWVFLGVIIHMVGDFADLVHYQDPFYFKLSQIYLLISNKKRDLSIGYINNQEKSFTVLITSLISSSVSSG